MQHQQIIEMTPLNETVDRQMQTENSRCVKIFLVKYKCILLFTFLGFAIFQMIYILIDKITSDSDFMTQLFHFLNTTRVAMRERRSFRP